MDRAKQVGQAVSQINNGNTTGAGLIKISSNDFTNNKEKSDCFKNIKNTGKIAVNEDISGKDTQNSGSMYSKNLKTDNLKMGQLI